MAYSAAILARAKARLAAAREQNAQDDAARIGAIYERLPRLRQIDLELQKTAAKVCAAAFRAGEDPSETIRQLKDENLRLQHSAGSRAGRFYRPFRTLRRFCGPCR